jgi:hypothetical protein
MSDADFDAPWGRVVWISTALATLVVAGAVIGVVGRGPSAPYGALRTTVALLLLAILPLSALFTIRGYSLSRDALLVRRLLWATRIPLDALISAHHDAGAMKLAVRLFGNGGLFAITGFYRNKRTGSFRAYATDPRQSVVLTFSTPRIIVVSPGDPARFITMLQALRPNIRTRP